MEGLWGAVAVAVALAVAQQPRPCHAHVGHVPSPQLQPGMDAYQGLGAPGERQRSE